MQGIRVRELRELVVPALRQREDHCSRELVYGKAVRKVIPQDRPQRPSRLFRHLRQMLRGVLLGLLARGPI